MKRSITHSASLFAAICLSAEAHSFDVMPAPSAATPTLAEKLQAVRRIPLLAYEEPTLEATPIQWFNWGNWRNCSNGQWQNC